MKKKVETAKQQHDGGSSHGDQKEWSHPESERGQQ